MIAVVSSVLYIMMFPYKGKIITFDQLTYYEKQTPTTPKGVLPLITSHSELIPSYTEASPGIFKASSLLGTHPREPSLIEHVPIALVCMMNSSNATQS